MSNTGTGASRGLDALAREVLSLESDTFEITDYADSTESLNASTCSSTSSSTCKGAPAK